MTKLTNPGYVSQLLANHQISLRKKWGQNFLVDENILEKIVRAAEIGQEDTIVEIGPGIGALTQRLAASAGKVIAVEIDGRLIPVLQETLREYSNVEIIHNDAVKIDYHQLLGAGPCKLVANLPYNIATILLYRWLKEFRGTISMLVCMVQKEVAQRITAQPGGKEYGTLSVVAQYAAQVQLMFTVPKTVFFPRPEVSSAVVRLCPQHRQEHDVGNEAAFLRVVEAVFSQRRKTILNTLHAAFSLSKEDLSAIGNDTGIDMSRRGETLYIGEFAKLSRMIYNKTGSNVK